MGKLLVRLTIIFVTIYELVSYVVAQVFGIDILRYSYGLLFELCVVVYSFSEGKYHCKYIKWSALGIFVVDSLSHLDYYFDFLPISFYNYILAIILFSSLLYSSISALRHFHNVRKLKRQLNEVRQRNERED